MGATINLKVLIFLFFYLIITLSQNSLNAKSNWNEVEIIGIKLRYGASYYQFESKFADVDEITIARDDEINKNVYPLNFIINLETAGDELIFPIGIEFRTNRNGRFYNKLALEYRHVRLNENQPYDVDINLKKRLAKNGTKTYLRQNDENLQFIYKNILNEHYKALADINPNWAISSDTILSSTEFRLNLGYESIVYNSHKYLILEPGIGFAVGTMKEILNFCSSFPIKHYEKSNLSIANFEAKCENKSKIDELQYTAAQFFIDANIIAYQFENDDHIIRLLEWRIIEFGIASLLTLGDKYPPNFKNHKYEFGLNEYYTIVFEYVYKI